MNNNDDYLWDRSGQPDPEIQQLEEILGTLRYQPRTLEIPVALKIEPRPSFFRGLEPRLAIAATIALALFGLGVWLGVQRMERAKPVVVGVPNPKSVPAPAAVPSSDENKNSATAVSIRPEQKNIESRKREPIDPPRLVGYTNRPRSQSGNAALQKRLLAAKQEKEAEAAKDQLMLALRMVSTKLNYAQKKTQTPNTRDLIHNQHKIG